ncbi:G-type lectin S-receptor-like serine/threonine-protein kinase At4g27290 isoform X1 [Prunus avium]|uniref:Receptor-like serine/threonine-protein kinase n=2 Tax=Prunus avium TaxID=42229 RepID=A0A6P5S2G1_PRUAV|nr:G-type lectin S-receptor-like serine/threonine-protein kinase At4g27290 isoform X1 [Prunus avium]XP_021811185.1 G-type lectin S-receptor-like serine/threonine-protein kinase At4g27290 isoform X1 [Prunus avium]
MFNSSTIQHLGCLQKFCASMDTKSNPKFVFNILLLCLFLKCHISLAADTISADQSLSGDQTIVSAGGVFELGFFKPGNSSKYYIGIWYSKKLVSMRTIVWVANRKTPVSDTFSSVLRISDGNLVLFSESETLVWSTNLVSATTSGSAQAVLLDSGNLVLRADGSNANTSEPLWQSFDHPAHTWLPGGRLGFNTVTNRTQIMTSWKSSEDPAPGLFSLEIDPNGSNAYLILWNRSRQYWTSGPWDESSRTFSFVPEMRLNYIYNYTYVTNKNESYFTYSLYNPETISRFLMHSSGQIQQLTWLENSGQWNLFWNQPRKQCEVYDLCGAFGSCNEVSAVACNCLTGFEPKSQNEWDLQAYSSGCSRITNLQYCGTAVSTSAKYRAPDGFQEIHNMSLPQNKQSVVVGNISECGPICLNNCSCTAYAYESSTRCSILTGDLLDLQQLATGDRSGTTLYIRLGSALPLLESGNANKRSLVIALVSGTAGLLTITFGYFLWKKTRGKERERRRKNGETKTLEKERKHRKRYDEILSNVADGGGMNDTELPLFSLQSVLAATNNFSEANKVGEGGFGPVYKGILPGNQEVAIKRLSKKSGQGHQEFMNELKLIAKLQHTNLVRLLGCCIEEEELILIYEFMPNRSLDKFLFDPSEKFELDWGKRFRIIEGIAQGILYIHKYSRLKIIHRDLKASNVLLDGAMNPKISDFGMAKIFEINQTEANTNRVVGTYGYMSPEYARYGHFSEKLDVFSFGVLLLEIVSGKKNAAFHRFEHSLTLAGWAWELWREGRGMEVIDASVRETCQPDEALKCIQVGFLCVQEDPADRPTMSSVILMLANEATSLPPSKEPAFSTHRNSVAVSSSPQTTPIISNNAVTISLPEGR